MTAYSLKKFARDATSHNYFSELFSLFSTLASHRRTAQFSVGGA